jgi:hypothetical protein
LTTLAFLLFLLKLRKTTTEEYEKWDMITTTISDYTMMYKIPERIFINFRDNIYPNQQKEKVHKGIVSHFVGKKSKSHSNEYKEDIEKSAQVDETSLMFAFKLYLK